MDKRTEEAVEWMWLHTTLVICIGSAMLAIYLSFFTPDSTLTSIGGIFFSLLSLITVAYRLSRPRIIVGPMVKIQFSKRIKDWLQIARRRRLYAFFALILIFGFLISDDRLFRLFR